MRLVARTNNVAFATNNIVLPVSDEVSCRGCHALGGGAAAQPAAGWAWNPGTAASWTVVTNLPASGPSQWTVALPNTGGAKFFRLRRP